MPYGKMTIFDLVGFKRWNKRLRRNENHVCVWMKTDCPIDDCSIVCYYGPIGGSEFCRAALKGGIGSSLDVQYTHCETRPASDTITPPKGYDSCPRRIKMTYPHLGEGPSKSDIAEQKRQDRIARRQAKLRG